jgi:hypothetical protein
MVPSWNYYAESFLDKKFVILKLHELFKFVTLIF